MHGTGSCRRCLGQFIAKFDVFGPFVAGQVLHLYKNFCASIIDKFLLLNIIQEARASYGRRGIPLVKPQCHQGRTRSRRTLLKRRLACSDILESTLCMSYQFLFVGFSGQGTSFL